MMNGVIRLKHVECKFCNKHMRKFLLVGLCILLIMTHGIYNIKLAFPFWEVIDIYFVKYYRTRKGFEDKIT